MAGTCCAEGRAVLSGEGSWGRAGSVGQDSAAGKADAWCLPLSGEGEQLAEL